MAPQKFSPEFKGEAVRAVIDSSRTIASVAREYGVGSETLRGWVVKYRREHAGEQPSSAAPLTGDERVELEKLRKDIRELRMEKEFLGKAAAFFAKEYR
jgi:transposase